MATNKDIIQKLECVETKLMSGELEEIHTTCLLYTSPSPRD